MVPYNYNKEPSLTKWSGAAMQASVVLNQPGNISFTNLDEISGKVVIRCLKSADVTSIVVKLEGESRTRLMSSAGPNGERPKPQLEYHKILYKVQMVFPPAEVLEGRSHMSGKAAYTLPQGQHEYPWSFKLPFNNACYSTKGTMPTVGVSGHGLELAKAPTRHVRKTLPPTLSGFPGEAEIRYFVKTTVTRHSFFKENARAYTPFNFFPIEPPRPSSSGSEVYARQRHAFSVFVDGERNKGMKASIFGKFSNDPAPPANGAPCVSVDARLPEPAILTCNQDIPLRIIVKKLSDCVDTIYLQSLQVSLIGNTRIAAHDVFRTESNSWIIMSKSNMGVPIGLASDREGTETVLDDHMWRGQPLPNTVAPSFETCNISREYQLDVRVGLSYSGGSGDATKPQTIVLPLRLDTFVYSGIAPPAEMLERMAEAQAAIRRASTGPLPEKLRMETRRPSQGDANNTAASQLSAAFVPPTPMEPCPPEIPARPGEANHQQPPAYNEAPPSYEDAVAAHLPPIDAPRPDYAPPPPRQDDILGRDEKKGWIE